MSAATDLLTPPAAPPAALAPSVTPEARAALLPPSTGLSDPEVVAAREHWIGLGLDPAKFDAAVTGAADPAAPPANDPEPAADPATRDTRQARELIANLRASGADDARIKAALLDDGYDADALLAAVPDDRPDDIKAMDAGGLTPGNPAEYQIGWMGRVPTGMDATQVHGADQEWRGFLAAIGAPALTGGSVAEEIIDAGQAFARLPEPAQALYKAEQRHLFNRVCGGEEAAAERLALASAALAKADPGFVAALRQSGALHSATVIAYLAEIGRVSAVRGAVQGGRSLVDTMGPR